jgi:redox-sensitive bicupin YhaK (pirin superfamily)
MSTHQDLIRPQLKDLGGGFQVRRVLPSVQHPAVGPFVFFDHFGPVDLAPDGRHDVRPHPHIGLATVTYLFEGAMQHADSTGAVQKIEPGAINWMTAGRGVVHSERMPPHLKSGSCRNHGLQLWVALPLADEETEPRFAHTPQALIPAMEVGGARVRVLVGAAYGLTSPVATHSPTLFLDIDMMAGDAFPLPPATQRAIYVVSGQVELDGLAVPAQTMRVLQPLDEPMLSASGPSRVVLLGGDPLGPRFLWWNFVSSRKDRLVQAANDWAAQALGQVPGETEFIPLPERRPGG